MMSMMINHSIDNNIVAETHVFLKQNTENGLMREIQTCTLVVSAVAKSLELKTIWEQMYSF